MVHECDTKSGATTYKCIACVELIQVWRPKKVVSPDRGHSCCLLFLTVRGKMLSVFNVRRCVWMMSVHLTSSDHWWTLHKFSKDVLWKTDNASQKIQLKNLQDSLHLMSLGQQPQMSSSFITGSQLSKFLIESSKVMSQPTMTSVVLIVDRDTIPGGSSSLQKSVLVSHLALTDAYVLGDWKWNWANQ